MMFQKIAKHRANDASNDVHRPPLLPQEYVSSIIWCFSKFWYLKFYCFISSSLHHHDKISNIAKRPDGFPENGGLGRETTLSLNRLLSRGQEVFHLRFDNMTIMKMTMTMVSLTMTMRMRIVFQGTPPAWPTSFQPGRSPIVQLFTISIQRDVLFLKSYFFFKKCCWPATHRAALSVTFLQGNDGDEDGCLSRSSPLHHFHSNGNRRGGLEKLDLFNKCSQAATHRAAFSCHIFFIYYLVFGASSEGP